jgi:hypothetical protein
MTLGELADLLHAEILAGLRDGLPATIGVTEEQAHAIAGRAFEAAIAARASARACNRAAFALALWPGVDEETVVEPQPTEGWSAVLAAFGPRWDAHARGLLACAVLLYVAFGQWAVEAELQARRAAHGLDAESRIPEDELLGLRDVEAAYFAQLHALRPPRTAAETEE